MPLRIVVIVPADVEAVFLGDTKELRIQRSGLWQPPLKPEPEGAFLKMRRSKSAYIHVCHGVLFMR